MRLNLGCGHKHAPGWVNVDIEPACNPDQICDLERFPWPWPTDSVEIVRLIHVLEHLGETRDVFLGIIRELYRVCRNGAEVLIAVPHPRHDLYLFDPTHVRPITPGGLEMFSQARNRAWIASGRPDTPLGIDLGVDFKMVSAEKLLSEPWLGRLRHGEISAEEIAHAEQSYDNVVAEYRIVLKAIKPPGSSGFSTQ